MGSPRDVLTRAAPPPGFTVAYGDHPDQVADVWLPDRTDDPLALVVFVHGGFWRAEWDRTHVKPLASALAAGEYAVAAIEYRRVGQQGGGWPGSFDDVALALDTVPHLVAEAAGPAGVARPAAAGPVTADLPVVLAGHSAGGHLVLWGAVRHRLPAGAGWRLDAAPPIAGVLALAPVADLADAYQKRLGEGAVSALLDGGPAAHPDRYAAVDPAALPRPEAPTVLVHGVLDDRVPVSQSREYAGRQESAGAGSAGDAGPAGAVGTAHEAGSASGARVIGGVRLVELPDAEHFAVIDPLSTAWPEVLGALRSLLR